MPGLTVAWGTTLAEAAAVCLEDRSHQIGVALRLIGLKTEQYPLEWRRVDEQMRRCYNDLQMATELGAYGIAILMVKDITGKVVIERSKKGTGFDYWLGDRDDVLLFSGKRRLEVSGLLVGSRLSLQSRVREKKEQMKPSTGLAPGYVAVVEFGTPIACVRDPSSIEARPHSLWTASSYPRPKSSYAPLSAVIRRRKSQRSFETYWSK
jgi:hypothetical protein